MKFILSKEFLSLFKPHWEHDSDNPTKTFTINNWFLVVSASSGGYSGAIYYNDIEIYTASNFNLTKLERDLLDNFVMLYIVHMIEELNG
jgi:hypothetical protein